MFFGVWWEAGFSKHLVICAQISIKGHPPGTLRLLEGELDVSANAWPQAAVNSQQVETSDMIAHTMKWNDFIHVTIDIVWPKNCFAMWSVNSSESLIGMTVGHAYANLAGLVGASVLHLRPASGEWERTRDQGRRQPRKDVDQQRTCAARISNVLINCYYQKTLNRVPYGWQTNSWIRAQWSLGV